MRLGYNTNGLQCHDWQAAFELIAEIGYRSVAITIDHHCLNPYGERFSTELREVKSALRRLDLACVIETGTRFLLDPRRKHFPTLLSGTSTARERRIDFLSRSIDIAAELDADGVSFWSGTPDPETSRQTAHDHLQAGLERLVPQAEAADVRLAFEPEPGMLIETLDQWRPFQQQFDSPMLGVTIDIGHLHCNGETPIPDRLTQWHDKLFNIHIEDMRAGIHDHLRFGEGEIDFPPIIEQLEKNGYPYGLHVELSRHSHMAPTVATESYAFLKALCRSADDADAAR